jgi:hypothetical protein
MRVRDEEVRARESNRELSTIETFRIVSRQIVTEIAQFRDRNEIKFGLRSLRMNTTANRPSEVTR